MSDSNRIQVSFLREDTWNTTPSSAFTELLVTGGRLGQELVTVESKQIRSDAQASGAKRVGADATAKLDVEWSADAFDELLRGGIRSDADWSTAVAFSASDVTVAAAGKTYTTAGGTFSNITKGQYVYVAGCSESGNNGWKKVTAIASGVMTVAETCTDEAAGASMTVVGQKLLNGTTKSSYSLQGQFQDLTTDYMLITGARVGEWNLDVSPGAIMTGGFGFAGGGITQETSKAGDGTVDSAAENDVMSEVDSINNVWIDNTAIAWDLFNFNIGVALGNRPQRALGNLTKIGMGQGAIRLTGGLEAYLDDDSSSQLMGDFLAFTKFQFAMDWDDGSGNRYLLEIPQVALTTEDGELPATDSDKMLKFGFAAEPGGTFDVSGTDYSKTIQLCRVQA